MLCERGRSQKQEVREATCSSKRRNGKQSESWVCCVSPCVVYHCVLSITVCCVSLCCCVPAVLLCITVCCVLLCVVSCCVLCITVCCVLPCVVSCCVLCTAVMEGVSEDDLCWLQLEDFRMLLIKNIEPSRITAYLRQCQVLLIAPLPRPPTRRVLIGCSWLSGDHC